MYYATDTVRNIMQCNVACTGVKPCQAIQPRLATESLSTLDGQRATAAVLALLTLISVFEKVKLDETFWPDRRFTCGDADIPTIWLFAAEAAPT
jgi:hypothetical protein